MKKIFATLLTLLCLFSLAACGQKEEIPASAVAGGYTEERAVTDEDTAILDEALAADADDGFAYTAEKVSTQVVAGTNYKFYAKAVPTAGGDEKYVHITVFVPLEEGEAPSVTGIADA